MSNTIWELGAIHAMEKISASLSDDQAAAAQIAGGAGVAYSGKNLFLGKKRMYHGTSSRAWKRIKDRGLMPDFGGVAHGAGATVGSKSYIDASRGKVHLTGIKPIASGFARLTGRKGGGGKVLKIDMDYRKYVSMEPDPDMTTFGSKASRKNIASRGAVHVTPDEIVGANRRGVIRRAGATAGRIPGYALKHPGRFSAGLAMAGGGGYLVHKGVKNLMPRIKEIKNKVTEKA